MLTYTTLPVHNNIVLVGESSEKDRKKNVMLFASTPPRYPITAHGLTLLIGEGIQPAITLEVVTILLGGLRSHFQNGVNTNKNLDTEFSSLKNEYDFIRLNSSNEKQNKCGLEDKELLTTPEGTTGFWRSKSAIPNQSSAT